MVAGQPACGPWSTFPLTDLVFSSHLALWFRVVCDPAGPRLTRQHSGYGAFLLSRSSGQIPAAQPRPPKYTARGRKIQHHCCIFCNQIASAIYLCDFACSLAFSVPPGCSFRRRFICGMTTAVHQDSVGGGKTIEAHAAMHLLEWQQDLVVGQTPIFLVNTS